MTTYYVRPAEGSYGAANGLSYDTAFDGFPAVTGLAAGDTLYVCGRHSTAWTPAFSGSSGNPITVRFDYAADPGEMTFSGSGTTLNINGLSHLTFESPTLLACGTTAGILVQGTTDKIILNSPSVKGGNTRGIYFLGNAHTNWELNDPYVEMGDGDITSGIAKQAIYIWGNSATAGTGGKIKSPVIRSSATSFALDATNFVGLQIEDWNNIEGRLGLGLDIDGFHTGLRLVDADSNKLLCKSISNCTNGGLKSDNTGGGYGVTPQATSTLNEIFGGVYDGNYQGYVDSSTVGGNKHWGSLHRNHTVNAISVIVTGAVQSLIANFSVEHSPVDTEGHGFVVQNGSASTDVKVRNGHITCDKTGANIQCVAFSGSYAQIDVDYMNYYVTNGASVGQLGVTDYPTLATWTTAVAAAAGIIGDEAHSTSVETVANNGQKWWTTNRPVGSDLQPFPDFNISRGGTQNRDALFHPLTI